MPSLLITGGRIIDPARDADAVGDIFVRDGVIVTCGQTVDAEQQQTADRVIDADGCIVSPGFIDPHVKLGEPGCEEDETIASGAAAAVAGGFTTIAALPDTNPVVDTRAAAEFISRQAERAGLCRVLPLGACTRLCEGNELAEIGQLVDGGAVGFTDGKRAIRNPEIMRRALQYAGMFDRAILHHPQSPELTADGVMHDGYWSTRLGLRGMPTAAEEIMVRRDIALAEHTGGRVHLMCISSLRSVEEIRRAKARGVNVTACVTPHHLTFTDEALKEYDARYKLDPPLRPQEHIDALIEGLQDGTIDIISSDHLPWAQEKTDRELDHVPFGLTGLETLLPICIRSLIEPGHLTWPQLLSKLTTGPAHLLSLPTGTLAPDSPADITIIDPDAEQTIDTSKFASQSRNSPYDGWGLKGQVRHTIVCGEERSFAETSR